MKKRKIQNIGKKKEDEKKGEEKQVQNIEEIRG